MDRWEGGPDLVKPRSEGKPDGLLSTPRRPITDSKPLSHGR
jgi:hypothetical protein